MHKTVSPQPNTATGPAPAAAPEFTFRQRLAALRQTLAGAFGIMMIAMTLAGALNYVFSIIMTRMLGDTGAFADFNTLNSIFLIVTMGSLAVQTVITKYVAEFTALAETDKTRLLIHHFSRWLVIASAIIIAVSLSVAWPLSAALKLDTPLYVVIVGTAVAITIYATVPYGLLQGEQRFLGMGAASISQSVLRILAGVALVGAGLGVAGALSAATVAGLLVTAVVIYYYRDYFLGKPRRAEDPRRAEGAAASPVVPASQPEDPRRAEGVAELHPGRALLALVPVAAAVFLVIFMTQIDVVLVKGLKSALLADRYSYGALAGKAVLFFPGGINIVMFPRVSAMRAEGKPTGRVLAWSLAACLLLESAVVGFYALFPGFTSSFFAGRHGKEIVDLTGMGIRFIVLFGLVMAVFALLNVLVYYHLALDRRGFIGLLVAGAAAEVAGILLFHETLPQVLLVMLVVGAALLALNLAVAILERPELPRG